MLKFKKTRFLEFFRAFLIAFLASDLLQASPYLCRDVVKNFSLDLKVQTSRLAIVKGRPMITSAQVASELQKSDRVIFKGNHKYLAHHAFVASNENDWSRVPMDRESADLLIGFGTNSAWDLAVRKKVPQLIIADWAQAPIAAQAFIVEPLIRLANTPQQLVMLIAGLPRSYAGTLSLEEAFHLATQYQRGRTSDAKFESTQNLMQELAKDSRISDFELRFLTNYFQPLLDGHRQPKYGVSDDLHPTKMLGFLWYWADRYNPEYVGALDSVFSTQENFDYLKFLFDRGRIRYAMAEISDPEFYKAVRQNPSYREVRKIAFSASNILVSSYNRNLGPDSVEGIVKTILEIFPEPTTGTKLTFFHSVGNDATHNYFRYPIHSLASLKRLMRKGHFKEPESFSTGDPEEQAIIKFFEGLTGPFFDEK